MKDLDAKDSSDAPLFVLRPLAKFRHTTLNRSGNHCLFHVCIPQHDKAPDQEEPTPRRSRI